MSLLKDYYKAKKELGNILLPPIRDNNNNDTSVLTKEPFWKRLYSAITLETYIENKYSDRDDLPY